MVFVQVFILTRFFINIIAIIITIIIIKSFIPDLSGTLEHTTQMANINESRIKKRFIVVTLLDLKKAFGEMHDNLIQSVLKCHHIPDHIENLVKSLCNTSITSEFSTPYIPVGRGVLQCDCLRPLLFNARINPTHRN